MQWDFDSGHLSAHEKEKLPNGRTGRSPGSLPSGWGYRSRPAHCTPSSRSAPVTFVDHLDSGSEIILADMGTGAGQVAADWFESMYERCGGDRRQLHCGWRGHADGAPAASAPLPDSRCAPIAGTGDGRSGRADISPATCAIARRCPAPKTPRSARPGFPATDARDGPRDARAAAPAPLQPIVHHSAPSVLSSAHAENSEQPQNRTETQLSYL